MHLFYNQFVMMQIMKCPPDYVVFKIHVSKPLEKCNCFSFNSTGAFLIPYVIMLFVEGLPLFYLELSIGQRHHLGPVPLWTKVSKYSSGLGFTSVFTVFFMACTYNVVIAWCLYYFFASFSYPLPWSTCPK